MLRVIEEVNNNDTLQLKRKQVCKESFTKNNMLKIIEGFNSTDTLP